MPVSQTGTRTLRPQRRPKLTKTQQGDKGHTWFKTHWEGAGYRTEEQTIRATKDCYREKIHQGRK